MAEVQICGLESQMEKIAQSSKIEIMIEKIRDLEDRFNEKNSSFSRRNMNREKTINNT